MSDFTYDPDEPDVELADVGLTEQDVEEFVAAGRAAMAAKGAREAQAEATANGPGDGCQHENWVTTRAGLEEVDHWLCHDCGATKDTPVGEA